MGPEGSLPFPQKLASKYLSHAIYFKCTMASFIEVFSIVRALE